MKSKFRISRLLILTLIVLFLAFIYFLVRDGSSSQLGGLKNPIDRAVIQSLEKDYTYKELVSGNYLVVEDKDDEVSFGIRDSVELALSSLGNSPIYTDNPTVEQINSAKDAIIVTRTYLDYNTVQDLFEYTQNGGFLIFAIRPEVDEVFKSIYQQLGIYEHYYYKDSKGFHAVPGMFRDKTYDEEGDWLYNSIIELHVREECTVLATNDDDIPLIWYLDYGKGKILFMNNSLMTYKSSGGLLLSSIANVKGKLMYPVVNAKVFALESFPLPTDVNLDYLKDQYLRSGRSFLRDLWWPNMAKISASCDIRYTAGFLTEYDKEVKYSSEAALLDDMDFNFYAKEIARYNGEIGFTGYNQKPLYFMEQEESMTFIPWTNQENAHIYTEQAINFFDTNMPDYSLYSFIPPERLLDDDGYEIIRKAFPNLQVICGDFMDKTRYYQNFGVDENNIAHFPVITEGFEIQDIDKWDLMNTSTSLGVIFHSTSTTKLMLETDPNKAWNKISRNFGEFCTEYIGTSPLKSLTVTEAGIKLREMLSLDADIQYSEDSITVKIKNMPEEASFMLLIFDGSPKNIPGVTCTKVHENKYLITTTVDEFTLKLK